VPIQESSEIVSDRMRCSKKAMAIAGIVLECSEQGSLLRIRHDDLGLLHGITPGIPFHHLIDRDNEENAFAFLAEIKRQASAFGWKLKFSFDGQTITLYFGGMVKNHLLLIFATRTGGRLLSFSRFFLDEEDGAQVGAIPENVATLRILNERELALQEQLNSTQNELANLRLVLSRKNTKLKKVISELRAARAGIHTLQSLLPICSSCKKIRDEQGDWHQVETYLRKHGGIQFTHSICPDCIKNLYPGLQVKK
jgi:hypothetical protein